MKRPGEEMRYAIESEFNDHLWGSHMIRTVSVAASAVLPALAAATAILCSPPALADNFQTQSGKVLCGVTPDGTLPWPDAVVCQGKFIQSGQRFAAAVSTGDGSFRWVYGANLAVDNPTTNMVYGQTYRWGNWSIYHNQSGTRFTNSRTGHGMFVSIENVYTF
jgi:hypothetical protein